MFRRPPRSPFQVDTDPAFDDWDLRQARDRVQEGDWSAARNVLDASNGDWERKIHRASVLAELASGRDQWLHAWLSTSPHDPSGVALVAAALNARAGQARGTAAATDTTLHQFQSFAELSEQSEA
ncbi:MAG TPA: hypothetical protein VIT20_09280 [Propionibacteriaceae bacterium]